MPGQNKNLRSFIASVGGRTVLFVISAVIIIGVSMATKSSANPSQSYTSSSATTNQKTTTSTGSLAQATPSAKSTAPSTATATTLTSPDQSTYVSNHSPSSVNESEQSICVTSPSADCKIVFTAGSTTKSLATETAGSNGAAYWTWTPKSAGLAAGSWTVSATASLNGQSKSSSDLIPLQIP